MGNTFTVYEWNLDKYRLLYGAGFEPEDYVMVYAGENIIKALFIMIKLKLLGAGCMKFEWR